jgi:hypothetical protein
MVTKTDKAAVKAHENTPLEGTDLSAGEKANARKEGAIEAHKESAKQAVELSTGTETNETEAPRFLGSDEIMLYADLVDLGIEQFKELVAEGGDRNLSEEKVAGLLKLERNGKNRTEYVKALCKRLGIKDPREVPGAGGPDYTVDVTPLTKL